MPNHAIFVSSCRKEARNDRSLSRPGDEGELRNIPRGLAHEEQATDASFIEDATYSVIFPSWMLQRHSSPTRQPIPP